MPARKRADMHMTLDPTSIDLADLSRRLSSSLCSQIIPGDKLEGQTTARDRVVSLLECSELEAELIVDTMVARGFLRFREGPEEPLGGAWYLQAAPR
jgi:hypothetical protein